VSSVLVLSGCKNNDEKARELGFKDYEEQNYALSKGMKTKSDLEKFVKKEEEEKKRLEEEKKRLEEEKIRQSIEAAYKIISCQMYNPPFRIRDYAGVLFFSINYMNGEFELLDAKSKSSAAFMCQIGYCWVKDILNKKFSFNVNEDPVRIQTDGFLGSLITIDRNSGVIELKGTKSVNYTSRGECEEIRQKF